MTKCDIMAPHNRFIKLGKFLEIVHIAIVAVIDEQMPCVKRCVPIFQVAAKKIVLSIKYAYEIENENYRKWELEKEVSNFDYNFRTQFTIT